MPNLFIALFTQEALDLLCQDHCSLFLTQIVVYELDSVVIISIPVTHHEDYHANKVKLNKGCKGSKFNYPYKTFQIR